MMGSAHIVTICANVGSGWFGPMLSSLLSFRMIPCFVARTCSTEQGTQHAVMHVASAS
jgi:hypothetical protein